MKVLARLDWDEGAMTTEDNEPLSGEVTSSFDLTETGMKASVRSRAASAIDRLFGSAVDWFGSRLERGPMVRRAKAKGEVKVIEALALAAAKEIERDPDLGRRAVEAHLEGIVRKRANVEAVVIAATEELKALPPPVADKTDPHTDEDELDGDWLNFFEAYAERASSDSMRKLWGRILSGEIRQPKSFSLSTLRVASELDVETARLFQEVAVRRINDHWIVRPDNLKGPHLTKMLQLEAAGLIQEANGTLGSPRKLVTPGEDQVRIGGLLLKLTLTNKSQDELRVPVIALSTQGKQLAAIIGQNEMEGVRDIVSALSSSLEAASAHIIVANNDDKITYEQPGIVLYPSK